MVSNPELNLMQRPMYLTICTFCSERNAHINTASRREERLDGCRFGCTRHADQCSPCEQLSWAHAISCAWAVPPAETCLSLCAGLPQLACLCLRQCTSLPAPALQALRQLTTLRALDLNGLSQVDNTPLNLRQPGAEPCARKHKLVASRHTGRTRLMQCRTATAGTWSEGARWRCSQRDPMLALQRPCCRQGQVSVHKMSSWAAVTRCI